MAIDRFIEKVCVQTAVLWEYTGTDQFGQSSFAAPVEISCRWEEKKELKKDDEGNEFVANAEILVTQDLSRNDYLYLGTLTDISSEPDPKQVEGAYEIRRFEKIPMIFSTTIFVRKVFI